MQNLNNNMNLLRRIKHTIGIFIHYYIKPNPSDLGYFGRNASSGILVDLESPQNIYLYDFARIGCRSTIMTMGNSEFIMKHGCLTAEGLVVVTSNHYQRIGKSLDGRDENNLYRDIIVEEDVWIGINVVLLSRTHTGRGAIIGAGAVVRELIPPYAVVVGNPTKVIKFEWEIAKITKHERLLYPENERFTKEQLECYRNSYK